MVARSARLALIATAGALVAALLVPGPAGTAATARAAGDQVLDVLVLGDSYAAGNGATDDQGRSQTYGPEGCLRSRVNWGEKYAAALRASGQQVRLVNHACSGGVTADFTAPRAMDPTSSVMVTPAGISTNAQADAFLAQSDPCNTRAFPDEESWTYRSTTVTPVLLAYDCTRLLRPQVDFVGPDVDLVLFTMGGNDAGFTSIVTSCFVPVVRTADACRGRVEAARASLPQIRQRLIDGIAAMRARGLRDDAKLVQLGYPWLQVDNDFTLPGLLGQPGYDAGAQVRALVSEGNAAIGAIVPEVNAGHPGQLSFVTGVPEKFSTHEPDATTPIGNPARWVNQVADGDSISVWYHPNRLGHTAYAELLAARGTFGAPTGPTSTTTAPAVRARLKVRLLARDAERGDRVRLRVSVRLSDGTRPRGRVVVRDVRSRRVLARAVVRPRARGTVRLPLRITGSGTSRIRVVYRDATGPTKRVVRRVKTVGSVR